MEADSPRLPWMEIPASKKKCQRSGGWLAPEEFTVDRSKPAGLGSYCRPCDRQLSREYYRANRERILAKLAAKRGPRPVRHCSECGVVLEGGQRPAA